MYEIVREKFIKVLTDSSENYTTIKLVHIVCDTYEDMPEPLPHWASGSVCEVLEEDRKIYKLSNNREWIEVFDGDSEGGGGSHTKTKLIIGGVGLAGEPSFDEEQIQKLLYQMDYDGSEVITND